MKNFYRSEIDGLRAIAIVAVIIYHAEISLVGLKVFTGGYLGVDIFFVISGYIITKIIIKEIKIPKKFLNEDLLNNQSLRSEFKEWVNSLWIEKDLLLGGKNLNYD